MPWFLELITTCDPDAGIPVTDADIDVAAPFEGWSECYMNWPKRLWYAPDAQPFAVPCMTVPENAWHIRYLADRMQATGRWIGNLVEVDGQRVVDGNHRVRACKYLWRSRGVLIDLPHFGKSPGCDVD